MVETLVTYVTVSSRGKPMRSGTRVAGALLTGVFAQKAMNDAGADGVLFGGGLRQLGVQALACAVTGTYALVVTWGILKLVARTIGLRVDVQDEREGLDVALHGEEAYTMSGGTGGMHAAPAEDDEGEDGDSRSAHMIAPAKTS